MGKTKAGEKDMGNVSKVLACMHPLCIYRPSDLSQVSGLPTEEVRRVLNHLCNGMIVEATITNEYGRKVLYQTKQEMLF